MPTKNFQVMVSCDESFKDFWPVVSTAWKKFFPEVKITCVFVTDRNDEPSDKIISNMKKYGEVILATPVEGIPVANQAKMARHIFAALHNDPTTIWMIEDIDTIPLQSCYVESIYEKYHSRNLLAVGANVYLNSENSGKFPISNMTATTQIFREILDIRKVLNWNDIINSFRNIKVYDNKEAINNSPGEFSDESLFRVLINNWVLTGGHVDHIDRKTDIRSEWVDRSWWSIDEKRLRNNEYVICNFPRPISNHYNTCLPIIKYIFNNDNIKKEDIIM